MNIQKYVDYFHDGILINIEQINDKIIISMESSQLRPEWNVDSIPLSDFETIKGKLHLEEISSIIINDAEVNSIKMLYDTGEILDFEIIDNKKVKLLVTWINYPPKQRVHLPELVEIEAEKIYWENIPDLYAPMSK